MLKLREDRGTGREGVGTFVSRPESLAHLNQRLAVAYIVAVSAEPPTALTSQRN